jgi:hypothetical protein
MLCTFTFPNGDVWNAVVPGFDGTVVLENFRVVSLSDGTMRLLVGPFTPRNPLEVGTPVTLVESKTHGTVVKTDGVKSLVKTGTDTDPVVDLVPNASLVYRMGTTIDKDLPPHHTVNGYLVPMEEEVATQEMIDITVDTEGEEENNTDDAMKGEQPMGVMDVSIPISDRSHATWKNMHLQQFTVYSHDDFLGVDTGEAAHYNTMDIMIDDTTILYGDMDDTHRTRIVDTNNVFSNLHWNLREMKPGITIPYAIDCRGTQSTTVTGMGTHYVVDGDWPTILEKRDINDRCRQIMHDCNVSEEEDDVEDAEETHVDAELQMLTNIANGRVLTIDNRSIFPKGRSSSDPSVATAAGATGVVLCCNPAFWQHLGISDNVQPGKRLTHLVKMAKGVTFESKSFIPGTCASRFQYTWHALPSMDALRAAASNTSDKELDAVLNMSARVEGLRKQSVMKARPQSMVKPPVPVTKAHAELRELGFTMHDAARNGDCFPLSAMAGFEITDLANVAAPTVHTIETVTKARIAAVDLVTGDSPIGGIDAAVVRENEDLTDTSILDAWKTHGHWRSHAGGSTAFMFAVAHNLKRPVIVMEREGDAILDPCYIYAKRDGNGALLTSPPHGGVPKTVPFVKQMAFADVLTALTERPNGYSLVEYDRGASHHSPLVYTPVPPLQDGDVTEEEDDVEDEATYTLEEHPPPRLYNVVRVKSPVAPALPRTFRLCDVMMGCTKPYKHAGICNAMTCGTRKRNETDHYAPPDDVARDDVEDGDDGVEDDGDDVEYDDVDHVPERTSSRPVARSAPQPPIMVHEDSFSGSFRTTMQREVDTYDLGYYNSDGQRAYKYVTSKSHGGYYVQATVQGQTRYIGKFDRTLVAVYAIIATRRYPARLGGDSGAVRRWIETMATYFADQSTSRATKRPRVEELE